MFDRETMGVRNGAEHGRLPYGRASTRFDLRCFQRRLHVRRVRNIDVSRPEVRGRSLER
jgi:hypothetical protein